MELIFNELSISPLSIDKYSANKKMVQFAKAISIARKNGFRNIKSDLYEYQIPLSPDYSLKSWLTDKDVSLDLKNQLFGVIIPPFIKEDDEEIMEEFVDSSYYFENEEVCKTACIGLAAAFLYETLVISLASSSTWCRNHLTLFIEKDELTKEVNVFNIHSLLSFDDQLISSFVSTLGKLVLVKSIIWIFR